MKAKTLKFLSVLAVLAMAFAAFAFVAPAADTDAATPTYNAGTITIDGSVIQVYDENVEIKWGYSYLFTESPANPVVLPDEEKASTGASKSAPIVAYIMDDVVVKFQAGEKVYTNNVDIFTYAVQSYDESAGKFVLSDASKTKFGTDGIYGASATELKVLSSVFNYIDAKDKSARAISINEADAGVFVDVAAMIDATATTPVDKVEIIGVSGQYDLYSSTYTLEGSDWDYLNAMVETTLALKDFTGTIYGMSDADLSQGDEDVQLNGVYFEGFTGTVAVAAPATGTITIQKWTAGDITVVKGTIATPTKVTVGGKDINATLPEGSKITFQKGTYMDGGWIIKYDRFVIDEYMLTVGTADILAGSNGIVVFAGENGLELSGAMKAVTDATVPTVEVDGFEVTFAGPAKISGSIEATTVTINGSDNYDVTFGSLTVFAKEAIAIPTHTAVQDKAVVNIRGDVDVDGILKVGDDAYVRIYGTLDIANGAKLYTAGEVVVDQIAGQVTEEGADTKVTPQIDLENKVFVYKDGSLTGMNVKQTGVGVANMAYVKLVGAGSLGINSTAVAYNNTYYNYSFMAFYPVAVQDIISMQPKSMAVKSIDAVATIIDEDVDLDLFYAKYKINYTDGTPSFVIVYKEFFTVTLGPSADADIPKADGYTLVDAKGNTVGKMGQSVELEYGEKYTLVGKTAANKYTYKAKTVAEADKAAAKIKFVGNVESNFEQVRSSYTITPTMGYPIELTITVEDDTNAFEVGETYMYYKVGESGTEVEVQKTDDKKNVITGLYTNDEMFFKIVDKKFYKFTNSAGTGIGVTAQTLAKTWNEEAIKFSTASLQPEDNTASFSVTFEENKVKQIFKLATGAQNGHTFTITFVEPFPGRDKTTVDVTPNADGKEVDMYVGEIYYVEWNDVKDYLTTVTYETAAAVVDPSQQDDPQAADPEKYTAKTEVTVGADARTYSLKDEAIIYIEVENKTEFDITVTIGDYSADVPANGTNSKVIANDGLREEGATATQLVLAVKGAKLNGWEYKTYDLSGTASAAVPVTGSAIPEDTAKTLKDVFTASNEKKISITNIVADKIVYFVHMIPGQHVEFDGRTSTGGYYGETMYVYPDVDEGWKVKNVRVYEELKDETLSEDYFYATADGDHWKFALPAYTVVIVPEEEANFGVITFNNYDGKKIYSTEVPKGQVPVYDEATYGIPTKPATATATYKFIGWTPELAEVTGDATYTANFEEVGPSSDDVSVTIGQKGQAINVVLYAIDGKSIGAGTITIEVSFTYIDEDEEISTDSRTVTLNYNDEGKTAAIISDTSFIQELGDYYSGAFAVTGTFTLGECQGEIIRTAYTPVEA